MSRRQVFLAVLVVLLGPALALGVRAPEVAAGGDTPTAAPHPQDARSTPRAGTIDPLSDTWRTTSLSARVSNPVVIAGPPTHNGPHPGVLQIRNVSSGSFEARFREWRYRRSEHNDTEHVAETAPYLVIESGRTRMPDGSVWVAGTVQVDGTRDWHNVTFPRGLPEAPTLLLTMQTAGGRDPVAPRARNVTARGFEAALFEEEALNNGHQTETVGYLAIAGGGDTGRARVNGSTTRYRRTTTSLSGAWKRVGPLRLQLEEEKSADEETSHVSERTHVLTLGSSARPRVFAQQVTSRGINPTALRASAAQAGRRAGRGGSGWTLAGGEPGYSGVSGTKSQQSRRLDLGDEVMTGLTVGENSNRPCFVQIRGAEGSQEQLPCQFGFTSGVGQKRSASLNGAAVRRLRVCAVNTSGMIFHPLQKTNRVKGVRIEGRRIRDDGSFDQATATDQYDLTNCGQNEWVNTVQCGPNRVATGVIAHFEVLGKGKRDLRGFQLICRRVVSQ